MITMMFFRDKFIKFSPVVFVVLLFTLTSLIFLNSPGTSDVGAWKAWANHADNNGLIKGFEINSEAYPPFASVILLISLKFVRLFGFQEGGAVKLSILLFLFLTSFVFWLWTKNLGITVLLHLSLLLNSAALKYIDVFFAPFLILALWALKEHKLTYFSILYSIACLIKWQPLIIAPFLALYIINIEQFRGWKQINFKRLWWSVIFPAAVILIATFYIYGVDAVWQAFKNTTTIGFLLSGNALNYNWIITHLLHVLHPDQFGGLIEGVADYIWVYQAPKTALIPRLVFFVTYFITLGSFFIEKKTFERLINYSLVGYFAYFTFNLSVHENHFFIAAILSIILFWMNREHLSTMFILIMISNINLYIFYGIDGLGLSYSRVINGEIDIALLLSIFNMGYFLFLWCMTTLFRKNTQTNNHFPQ